MIDLIAIAAGAGGLAFQAGLNKLAENYADRINGHIKPNEITTDLKPHLEATFERCTRIKTLLSGQEPSDFLAIHSTQRFNIKRLNVDHYDLVDRIRSTGQHMIITGSGGTGKSMFMRYLWLSLFIHSDGRIPIFVELRNINSFSTPDIIQYVYHTITQNRSSISQDNFKQALWDGELIVILDGFDEVAYQKREPVQRSIMELSENYPKSKIVISSRPDENFASWTSFHVASVGDLRKEDALELIQKADFEDAAKERLSKAIEKSGFYSKHKSFLVNPLLASMMLLAFSRQYDIPDKMHEFYELAFQALYERHDSYKPGGYKREFKSELGEGDFRRLLSYFCLVSYYDETFSFSRPEILSYIEKAKRIMRANHDASDFLHDLVNAVCLVVPEGTDFAFAHRSFQEYFAAYCMSYVTSNNFDKFLERFARRPNDQVVRLISDMAPEKLRDLYILPKASEFSAKLKKPTSTAAVSDYFVNTNASFIIRLVDVMNRPARSHIDLDQDGSFNDYIRLVGSLNNFKAPRRTAGPDKIDRDEADVQALAKILGLVEGDIIRISPDGAGSFSFVPLGKTFDWNDQTLAAAIESFVASRMYEYMASQLKSAAEYTASLVKEGKGSAKAMDEIFDFD